MPLASASPVWKALPTWDRGLADQCPRASSGPVGPEPKLNRTIRPVSGLVERKIDPRFQHLERVKLCATTSCARQQVSQITNGPLSKQDNKKLCSQSMDF